MRVGQLGCLWLCCAVACASAKPAPTPSTSSAAVDSAASPDTLVADTPNGLPDAAAAETALPETVAAVPDSSTTAVEISNCKVKPTLASLEKEYFGASCAFGSCHSAAKHAGELVLESGKSYQNLLNTPALHPGAGGWERVVPGKPDDSFLYVKVTQPQPGQGKLMPVGVSEPLDPDCAIAALKAWIAAGAKP